MYLNCLLGGFQFSGCSAEWIFPADWREEEEEEEEEERPA